CFQRQGHDARLPHPAAGQPVRLHHVSGDVRRAGSAMLGWNRYGKASVRLVKVVRGAWADDLVDLTVAVQLEGDFGPVFAGSNRACLPTDTMKNTVYALARPPFDSMEEFALRLADHFIAKPAVSVARITATQHPWRRLAADGRPHPHAFQRDGG